MFSARSLNVIATLAAALVLAACAPVTINVNGGEATATNAPAPAVNTAEPTAAPPTAESISPTAEAPTDIPPEAAVPGSGTAVPQTVPTSASNPQGVAYTLVFTEEQINGQLTTALAGTQTDFVSGSAISLQNGTITKNTVHSAPGPGGQTVNGTVVIAVSASNCDLVVSVVQATVGQFNMTDAHKAALGAAYQTALSTALAQARDYTCVESVTIANGTMTVVYH